MGNQYIKNNTGADILYSTGAVILPSIVYNYPIMSITVEAGTYRTANTPDFTGSIYEFSLPEKTMAVLDNTKYYVNVSYNDGNPIMYLETDIGMTNDSNILPIYTIFIEGDEMDVLNWGRESLFLANKLNERFIDTLRYGRVFGLELSTSNNSVISAGGAFYLGSNRIEYQQTDSLTDECELLVKNPLDGWISTQVTVYPNTKYDDGSGVLADLTVGEYGVVWVWRSAGNEFEQYIAMGTGSYSTLELAKADKTPSDLPEKINQGSFLIGRIIFLNGATTDFVESAFDTVFQANVPTNHEALLNLLGGGAGEHYHLTLAKHTVVQNTSGTNTGDDIKGDLTSVDNKITVTNGVGSVIGSGTTLEVIPSNILHNDLSTKQGGTTDEYNHLTNTQVTKLNNLISVLTNQSQANAYSATQETQTFEQTTDYQKLIITFTPELVSGGLTYDSINKRIVYSGVTKHFYFDATCTILQCTTNNTTISFRLYKNGLTPLIQTTSINKLNAVTDKSTLNASIGITLNNNDYIEVWGLVDKNCTFDTLYMQLKIVEDISNTFKIL